MRKFSFRKNPKQLPLLAFLFIILSIPLAVYAVLNIDSFDIRDRAADTTVQPNSCVISFPFVNPESIEVDKLVQVEVSAYIPEENISQVSIMDRSGAVVFKKDYTNTPNDKITESFTFTSPTTGEFSMLGTLTTDKSTKPCVIEENRQISVITSNLAPEFKSLPAEAKPANAIKVKDSYEYLLKVEDVEKDTINYAFSFTPGAEWLKYTVIEDGGDGKLTIKFTGIPDKPASYLANIFVHDGYNQHLRAQSWVISVDQDKNDVPKVSVYAPSKDTTVTKGAKVKISWEATDLNLISKYEVFLTSNPGNQKSWISLEKNLTNKVGNYLLDTSSLEAGTYQVVVRATDNYDPPAQGIGISPRISVDVPTPDNDVKEPDDGIILVEPQIINVSPSSNSKLKNKKATISATLIAGTEAKIVKDTIKVLVNDKDVTKDVRINEITEEEFSIIYTTKEDFKIGNQKVSISFKDSKSNEVSKDWTFSIIEDSESEKTDVYKIFGFEIPKRTAWIIGGGILLLLLAILIPWILYLLWRGSKEDDDYETIYNNTYPVTPTPSYKTTEPMEYEEEKKKDKKVEKKEDTKVIEKKEQPKKEDVINTKETFIQNTTTVEKIVEKPEEKPSSKTDLWVPTFTPEEKKTELKIEQPIEAKKEPKVERIENSEKIIEKTTVEKVIEKEKDKPAMWTPTYTPEKKETVEVVKEEVKPEETKIEVTQTTNITEPPIQTDKPVFDSIPVVETPMPTPAAPNEEVPPYVTTPVQEPIEENSDEAITDVTEDEITKLANELKKLEENETPEETDKKPTEPTIEPTQPTKAEDTNSTTPPVVEFNSPTPQDDEKTPNFN